MANRNIMAGLSRLMSSSPDFMGIQGTHHSWHEPIKKHIEVLKSSSKLTKEVTAVEKLDEAARWPSELSGLEETTEVKKEDFWFGKDVLFGHGMEPVINSGFRTPKQEAAISGKKASVTLVDPIFDAVAHDEPINFLPQGVLKTLEDIADASNDQLDVSKKAVW